jgi:hypothetical protein
MSNTFALKINSNDLNTVKSMLADLGTAAQKVVYRALNKTLTGVRTDASAAIREVINASKSSVDETFKITNAQIGTATAKITSTGNPIALIDFTGTRQTNKGVSVQVRKDRARKVIPGTFIQTMKSGHKGVFWREYHQGGSQKNKMEVAANRAGFAWSDKKQRFINMAWLPGMYRFKIKELYSTRIPDYLVQGPVIDKILDQAGQRLKDNLDHETDYELSKYK